MKRNKVTTVGRVNVGMVAVRYLNATGDRRLTQQAIFQAPDGGEKLYYYLELSGPGKPVSEAADVDNPGERLEVQTFMQVVDSVKLLDLRPVVDDQIRRLFHSKELEVNWTSHQSTPIRQAIIPEQWQRIVRDGRDVGYQYIVESIEKAAKPEQDVIHIGIRSRMMADVTWDMQTWMNCTIDRKHESWWTAARGSNAQGKLLDGYTQIGASDQQVRAVAIKPQKRDDGSLTPQGSLQDQAKLEVVRSLRVDGTHMHTHLPPLMKDVPDFYLPQVFSYLLPSLLPLDHADTYMFGTFVPAPPSNSPKALPGEVWLRYLDVKPVQDVQFNGRTVEAIEIDDHIGLEGPITRTYYSPDGKFLGSESSYVDNDRTSTVMVLPSDAETLERLWTHPDLSRPNDQQPSDNDGNPANLSPPVPSDR